MAETVCIAVLETPPMVGEGSTFRDQSSVWEGASLDALFDEGHIVCNRPVEAVAAMPASGWGTDEALDGGASWFFLYLLAYSETTDLQARPILTSVSWRAINLRTKGVIKEGSMAWKQTNDTASIAAAAKRLAVELAKSMKVR